MSDDTVDWENVARNYQEENENLRLSIIKSRSRSFSVGVDVDFDKISRFVEKNYVFVALSLLALSYFASFCVDIYRIRKEFEREQK